MTLSRDELQQLMDAVPMIRFLDMTMDEVDADSGEGVFTLPIRPELHRAKEGAQFHGGAIGMFIDTAGDFMVAALVGGAVPTINLRIDYLRPATGAALRGVARLRRLGRTIAVVDIDVFDPESRLCAIGRATYSANPG